MLFNSIQYLLLFLPLCWLGFHLLGRLHFTSGQLLWLVVCSLFFYASWNPIFVLLILASVTGNFIFGRLISQRQATGNSLPLLTLGVSFNLALLAYFKYTGFFIENLNSLANTLIPLPEITLPLAISFFTFQQIAYLVDVHRDEAKDYSFIHYCLFVTFFPQLVAGPIVHHKEMMPQFDKPAVRGSSIENIQVGTTIIILGLFKKIILADNLALFANPLFLQAESGAGLTLTEAWVAVGAFTGQIYFDFSGYTDIAIGSARLFGIKLPENFYSPYKSTSIIEFWRRWHITLSRFLRDYLYISMGGNRRGSFKRYRNLALTMLLGGLWHGAHWNFVIWGALHGTYLIINHFWRYLCGQFNINTDEAGVLTRTIYQVITLLAVMVAWVFFRAESTDGATVVLMALIDFGERGLDPAYIDSIFVAQPAFGLLQAYLPEVSQVALTMTFLILSLLVCLLAPNTQQFMGNYQPALVVTKWPATAAKLLWRPSVGYAVALAPLLYLALLGIGSASEFIYFQF
jgi:alginate O-acetyltransferase complex protein AlgI